MRGDGGKQGWDEYFLDLARATAARAACLRRPVGAVLVQHHHLRATGYSSPPPGFGPCAPRPAALNGDGRCVCVPAEAGALLDATPEVRDGASLYTTAAPTFGVAALIASSGVKEVVAAGGRYEGWDATRRFLQDCGLRVRVLDGLEHAVALPL